MPDAAGAVLRAGGFHEQTPLWYYILKEAQLFHRGERLGPVGSRIVAETLVGLIRVSPYSILDTKNGVWKPTLGQRQSQQFGMVDLLMVAGVVNPLGA